jgi:hypothetical protein
VNELALRQRWTAIRRRNIEISFQELQSLGINIVNVGVVTSPLLYFAAKKLTFKSGSYDNRQP